MKRRNSFIEIGQNEEALSCFQIAAENGCCFAKQQVVALNPYAALCNKMLKEMIQKTQQGQSF
jgi:hypothetical protein